MRDPAAKPEKLARLQFLLFFLPLLLGGILFCFWPKEVLARDEQRTLAQLPEFTVDSLFSGSWTSGVEAWFADQFPLRQGFLSINRGLTQLIQLNLGGGGAPMQIITARKDGGGQGQAPAAGELAETTQSTPENATAAAGESAKAVATGPDGKALPTPEETTAAPKPGEQKVLQKAAPLTGLHNNDYESSNIVIAEGRAMEIHYYNAELTAAYAERVNYLRQKIPASSRMISLVAPTSVAFYGTDELQSGSYSSYDAIKNVYEHESSDVYKVDAYTSLAEHRDEYLYFRTDHHWNGLGAYYAYQAFCEATGETATPLDAMKLTRKDESFYGTLYGYTDKNPLLNNSADIADIYLPKYDADYTYYSSTAMEDGIPGLLLWADSDQENQYMNYLGGDVALGYIHSENKNGKSILIIKDSYGNAFIPYLIDNYEDIYVVDPRALEDPLLPFIEEKKINDVMMLNYTFVVGNRDWLAGFDAITGYQAPQD